jgi:hypothetical protein
MSFVLDEARNLSLLEERDIGDEAVRAAEPQCMSRGLFLPCDGGSSLMIGSFLLDKDIQVSRSEWTRDDG